MPHHTRFFFGRFNVLTAYEDKKKLLLEGLQTKEFFASRRQRWGFFDVREEASAHGTFLRGFLAKFKTLDDAEVADLTNHSISVESIENRVIAKSLFYLHIKTGLIAFHPVAAFISISTFRHVFSKIFEKGLSNFFVESEISMIDDRVEFFRAVESLDRIFKIKIILHPSNPHSGRMWKRLDQRIKRRNATTLTEELRNDKPDDSLRIENDLDLRSKFMMANDGYGVAEVSGTQDGQSRTFKTSQNPVTVKVPTFQLTSGGVLEILISRFAEVMTRINDR